MDFHKTKFVKILISCILYLGFLVSVQAQKPFIKHYTVNDGLAGSTVYSITQDSKGFIWFATETGVSKFDGINFYTYTIKDGLSDDEIFDIVEDSKGRLWFQSYNGKISYYKDQKFYSSQNKPFLGYVDFSFFIKNIYEDKKGRIWFTSAEEGVKCLLNNDSVVYVSQDAQFYNSIYQFNESKRFLIGQTKDYRARIDGLNFHSLEKWNGDPVLAQSKETDLIIIRDDSMFIKREKGYQKIPFIDLLTDDRVSIYHEDESGNLWVGTLGKGLYKIADFKTNPKVAHYLESQSISYIFEDKENNIWISTLGQGIYFLPVNTYLTYTRLDGLSDNFLYSIGDFGKEEIVLGTSQGSLNILNTKTNRIKVIDLDKTDNDFNKIRGVIHDHDMIWAAADKGLYILDENYNVRKFSRNLGSCKAIVQLKNKDLLIGTSSGLFRINPKDATAIFKLWNNRTTAIAESNKETIWIGTLDGLYLFEKGKITKHHYENDLLDRRITDIAVSSNSKKLVGTYGYGLVAILPGDRIMNITMKDGLLSNFIRSINIDKAGDIWISSDRGLNRMILNNKGKILALRSYTSADGLLSQDVEASIVKEDTVYVATSDGLTLFNKRHPQSSFHSPEIYITEVEVNGDRYSSIQKTLDYDENNLVFRFSGISFESIGDIKFRYKLEGIDKDWVTTENTTVSYPSLPAGEYHFLVYALARNGMTSDLPAEVEFTISPHFIDTWWFRIIISLFITLVAGLIIVNRISAYNRSEQIKNKLVDLEHKALRTQMNPHFIFNTMSSIQQFITLNDKRSAHRYLSKFADLMRMILDNSQKSFLLLEDELNALKLYLELEELRFDGKFSYEIKVDKNIELQHLKIPTMLIQPYVENAILHGLSPLKGRKGKLTLNLELLDDQIKCTILDNGVGRKAAQKIKENRTIKHKSTAMRNIEERIRLYRSTMGEDLHIEIEDMYKEKSPSGTKVTIILPTQI